MRHHQSMLAQLDNIFKPIESLFETRNGPDNSPSSPSGSYAAKRREEKSTRPLPSIVRYLEQYSIGSPRTRGEFRSLVSKKPLAARFLDQLKPRTKFLASALGEDQLPLATFPEIAVVGRSNTGKSTLINAIVGTRCCQVVDKPGSTEKLNFYRIGDPPMMVFVDVPGFGFSYGSAAGRDLRNEFALWYLRSRRNLRCVILVVDARHGLSDCDRELITFFKNNKVKYFIAVNKCDLVDSKDLAQRLTVIGRDLEIPQDRVLDRIVPVSGLRLLGVDKLRSICEKFKLERSVTVNGETRSVSDLLEARRLRKSGKEKKSTRVSLADFKDSFQEEEKDERSEFIEAECVSYSEAEPAAYKPDEKSILKRVLDEPEGEIRLLEVEDFVSRDEERNLGMRGGKAREDLPAPSEDTDTQYEAQMRLNHQLDWKMRLALDDGQVKERDVERSTRVEGSNDEAELSAMGFISTHNAGKSIGEHVKVKGIHKWKIPGLKPTTKTSRYRKPKDVVASISDRRIH